MSYSAKAIANYYVHRGLQEKRPIDPMKLQKLIYFAHGWHLAIHEEPLLDERVEAWPYGPVVPTVYHAVKTHGPSPIDFPIFRASESSDVFSAATRALLDRVWDVYGDYPSIELSNMSHDPDGPWFSTWRDKAGNGSIKGVDIEDDEIKEYFVRLGSEESSRHPHEKE